MRTLWRMEKETNQTVFVLDTYNKYVNRDKVRRVFQLNGRWFALYEVKLIWGTPDLGMIENEGLNYRLFNTIEEANECINGMLAAARIPF